jgi:putative Mg2+ transporter-C (MgtC) family protein
VLVLGLGQRLGQGWTEIGYLALAFGLSLSIGYEREARRKSAGLQTYPLVGVGAALFMLVSKYGFGDVLGEHVTLDPSRVAAQIVTGVGFIGGGLIFVRRDVVRGLTTAASVWLTVAVGMASGAGLPVLAAVTTGFYFVVLFGLRPLTRVVGRAHGGVPRLRVAYLDGQGALLAVLDLATQHGFALADLAARGGGSAALPERDEPIPVPLPVNRSERPSEVTLTLTGKGSLESLTAAIARVPGVLTVHADPRGED